ncbi:hypothetical protein RSW84_27720, partial [Escherichia coli]|uniref:hypothetical protein n=1 Tax=Escherichia coli TaxID=562 RepID=UPI0028DF72BF
FKGDCFDDGMCLNYWPLPKPDYLDNFDLESQQQYWSMAATHFDQNDWLPKTSVRISKVTAGRATPADAIELSATAAQLLASHK